MQYPSMHGSHLHIVSFNIPFPADYGGVIDVFYKLKALKKAGAAITLHCFEYGRQPSAELEKYGEKVFYYKRRGTLSGIFTTLPYIVNSRQSEELMQNLLKDDAPVLFEGLHTCYYLDDERLKNRFKIYRESNIEHEYYAHLAEAENNFFRKTYFRMESSRLKRFEKILHHASLILPVSTKDAEYFSKQYPAVRTEYLPSFHPNDEINIAEGKGDYVLYHGNLSVPENKEAVLFLVKNVFGKTNFPCVIAGLNPNSQLKNFIASYKNIRLVENPAEEEMNRLIRNAQVNLLITFQSTGLKLKLLNTLFAGRHCIVNPEMLTGTDLHGLCEIAVNAEEMIRKLNEMMQVPFERKDIEKRKTVLPEKHSNRLNAERLMKLIHY